MNNLNSPRETNYEAFDLSDIDSRLADLANKVGLEEQGTTSILPDQIPYPVIVTQIGALGDQVDSIFDITNLDIATETIALLYADPYITDRFQVLKEYLSQLSSLENQPEITASLSTTNNAKNDRELIANTIPLLQEMLEDESISQTEKYEIFVIYKYLELFFTELKVARAKYIAQAHLDVAEKNIGSHTKIETSKIEKRKEAVKKYEAQFATITSAGLDIKAALLDIKSQEQELRNAATQDIQNKVENTKKKSKIGIIIDIIFERTKKPENIEKELDGLSEEKKEQLRKLQNTRESLYKLRDMYEEYAKHMGKVSKDGMVNFGDRIKGIKKKIEDMSADDVIDVIVTDVVEEATKMGGHPPANREKFKQDIKKWYETVEIDYKKKQIDDPNFKPSEQLFGRLNKKNTIGLLKILIDPKNGVYNSYSDLTGAILIYNGKKYIQFSTRSLKYTRLKRANLLMDRRIPLQEFEDEVLGAMDYNEKEAFLIAIYRQSRFIGKRGAGMTKFLFDGVGTLITDRRPGGNITKARLSTFFRDSKKMTSNLKNYLDLASKHLSEVDSKGNQKAISDITQLINDTFKKTALSTGVLERVTKNSNKKFADYQVAKKSLIDYLHQPKYIQHIEMPTINKYIATIGEGVFIADNNFSNHTWKKSLGEGIAKDFDKNIGKINNTIYQSKSTIFSKLKKTKDRIAPLRSVRGDISKMNQALGQAGKYIGNMISAHSSDLISSKVLGTISKRRLASAIAQVTQIGREGAARVGNIDIKNGALMIKNAEQLKQLKANLDIVFRYAPGLASSLIRSTPLLSLPIGRKEDKSLLHNASVLAKTMVPMRGPLYIVDDALGKGNLKTGELAVGTFFMGVDGLILTHMVVKGFTSGWGPAVKSVIKWSADPIIAAMEMPKLLSGGSITGYKIVKDSTKLIKRGIKLKDITKAGGYVGGATMISGALLRAVKEYGDSIDTDITNKYAKLLNDIRTSNISEKEKYQKMQAYYDEKREHIKINNATKKYMLQLQSSYFVQNYEGSRDELRDPTTIGVSKKPDFIRFDISKDGTINVFLNKIIPYTSYAKFSEAFREHIQGLLPDGSTWKFKEGTNSFLYGKEIFEEIIGETAGEFDHTVDPLQQFQKDMQLGDVQQKKGKVIQRRNYIEKALDRRGIGTGYTQERLHNWTKRYADNHIKGKKK